MWHNAEPQNLSEEGECGDCKEKDGEEKFQGFYPNQLLPNALENEESSDSETIPYKEDESEVDQQIEREPSVEEETLGQDERGGWLRRSIRRRRPPTKQSEKINKATEAEKYLHVWPTWWSNNTPDSDRRMDSWRNKYILPAFEL